MVTLTNPINRQNIVDRFADYVVATANAGIVWGTGTPPFPQWDKNNIFGGTTAGKAIEVSGTNLGTRIGADAIYNTLIAETRRYGRIRLITAQRFITGNTGGTNFNQTQVAHLSSVYDQSGDVFRGTVVQNAQISSGALETLFTNMRAGYNILRANNAGTFVTSVCHSSCHSSCHGSRSRR